MMFSNTEANELARKFSALTQAYSDLERYAEHLSAQLLDYQLKEPHATDQHDGRVAAVGLGN